MRQLVPPMQPQRKAVPIARWQLTMPHMPTVPPLPQQMHQLLPQQTRQQQLTMTQVPPNRQQL